MKRCLAAKFLSGILAAGVMAPTAALAQGTEGDRGMQLAVQACTYCHAFTNITNSHKPLTAEEWEFYFYEMVSRGAPVYEEDMEAVKQYLIDNFSSDG